MITVYSTPNCVNCNSLKQILKSNQIQYEEKTIGVDIQKEALEELSGVALRAAPVVFRDSTYVGGMGETMALMPELIAEKTASLQAQMIDELRAAGVVL